MRHAVPVALVLAALALGGCSTTDIGPSEAELKARWDAQNIYPQNYKADLLAFLHTYLNDPSHVRDATVSPPQLRTADSGDRYVVCVRYNARNTDGKYMGMKDGAAVFVSGKLDRFFDTKVAVGLVCKDAAYEPFPELEKLAR